MRKVYLQHILQILDDMPVSVVELVCLQASGAVQHEAIYGRTILECEQEHVVC